MDLSALALLLALQVDCLVYICALKTHGLTIVHILVVPAVVDFPNVDTCTIFSRFLFNGQAFATTRVNQILSGPIPLPDLSTMANDRPKVHIGSVVSLASGHIHALKCMRADDDEGWVKDVLFTSISARSGSLLDELLLDVTQFDTHFVQLSVDHVADCREDRHGIEDDTDCCKNAHAFHDGLGGIGAQSDAKLRGCSHHVDCQLHLTSHCNATHANRAHSILAEG